MPSTRSFAVTLRAVRLALGLSQGELGKLLGIGARTVGRWELGRGAIGAAEQRFVIQRVAQRDLPQARRLAASLGGTIEAYGVTPPPEPSPTAAQEAANLALYQAAEQSDLSPKRLRAALLDVLERLDALGLSVQEARALLGGAAKKGRSAR